MYAVASINLPNYQDLADLTDAPKREYCEKYSYHFSVIQELKYSPAMGFNKIGHTIDVLDNNPDIEWLLFCECDATITNLTIKIEDKIDNNYHFIIPVDRLGINAGNFLVRNSGLGRAYLQMIMDNEPSYRSHERAEQQVIQDTYEQFKHIVKLVPQKTMNSYISHAYLPYVDVSKDLMGNSAEWEPTDWILHVPGLPNDRRFPVIKYALERITR